MEQLAKCGPDAYLKNLNIITADSVPGSIAPERFYKKKLKKGGSAHGKNYNRRENCILSSANR